MVRLVVVGLGRWEPRSGCPSTAKIVATKRVQVHAGRDTISINLPKRLQDQRARYRLQVWATGRVDLDSKIEAGWIDFRP